MNGLIATYLRELRAYFLSPLAWVILTFFLLINGVVFTLIVSFLADPASPGTIMPLKLFFGGGTFFSWMILYLVVTLLTMRLLSEERRSGTIESLMTAPVSAAEIVAGKFLAVFTFWIFLWIPLLAYVVIVSRDGSVDWGPIASVYLGIFAIGGQLLAVGILGSSFTKNQIVAALITFSILIVLMIVPFTEMIVTDEGTQEAIRYVNMMEHMDEFSSGIVDSRRIVYYLTSTFLLLFMASHVLESRKWS